MIEAVASGIPVATYPVTGPTDAVTDAVACLNPDLDTAIAVVLTRDRAACVQYGSQFTWEAVRASFSTRLVPMADGFDRAA